MSSTSQRAILLALLFGFLYAGCSGDDERAYLDSTDTPPDEPGNGDGDPDPPASEPDASTGGINDMDASTTTPGGGDAGDASTVIVYNNCGEAICAGTKKCVERENSAHCECDRGFVSVDLGDGNFECATDTACMQMIPLRCKQDPHGAVYQAFHVQYCSGEPYPADQIDVAQSFIVMQDNSEPDPNESYWTFRANDVESIVTVALDASGSVINDTVRFEPLIQSVRNFVTALRPGPDDPPLSFGLLLFGRDVQTYIEHTSDLDAVDAQLATLQTNGADAVGIDPGGTALYDAVLSGLFSGTSSFKSVMEAREIESGGALTFGTLVVITDGENESGGEILTEVKDSVASVVSMGINANISDGVLTAIGKDGSFLAPSQSAWESTLTEVAQRIRARTDSVYEVAYCSPATTGKHSLTTKLADPSVTTSAAICKEFDALKFGPFTSNECIAFVDNECSMPVGDAGAPPQCGGEFQVCPYTCAGGEACVNRTCVPASNLIDGP